MPVSAEPSGVLREIRSDISARVVEAIGDAGFYQELVEHLHDLVGAEHCAVMAFEDGGPVKLGAASIDGSDAAGVQIDLYLKSYWRSDPTMVRACSKGDEGAIRLERLDLERLPPCGLRDVVYRRKNVTDRLLLHGVSRGHSIALSIVCTNHQRTRFSSNEVDCLLANAPFLMAAIGKHTKLITGPGSLSVELSSLDGIAERMAAAEQDMSAREVQVCARILFGMTSYAIALDLAIGEETVKTYRKRAYQRLKIGTQRELLMWYLNISSGRLSRQLAARQRSG